MVPSQDTPNPVAEAKCFRRAWMGQSPHVGPAKTARSQPTVARDAKPDWSVRFPYDDEDRLISTSAIFGWTIHCFTATLAPIL